LQAAFGDLDGEASLPLMDVVTNTIEAREASLHMSFSGQGLRDI
jgi:hypothetical protein